MTPMELEALALSLFMGIVFGGICHWLWCWSPGKVLAVLVLIFGTTTLPQQLWRIFEGTGSLDELLYIGALRISMAVAAVSLVALLHRRCE